MKEAQLTPELFNKAMLEAVNRGYKPPRYEFSTDYFRKLKENALIQEAHRMWFGEDGLKQAMEIANQLAEKKEGISK